MTKEEEKMKLVFVGSSRFVEDMKKIEEKLSKKNIECQLIEPLISEDEFLKENSMDELLKQKPFFTKRHFKKIENSDGILVVNHEKKGIKGYMGPNTLMEIAVAFHFDKPIFFLNAFEKDNPFFEELTGLNATILNGDLSKIK